MYLLVKLPVFAFAIASLWPSILLSVALHELGHFGVARLLGIEVFDLSFRSLFGWRYEGSFFGARLFISPQAYGEVNHEEGLCWWKDALVSAGGPAANVLVCIVILLLTPPLGVNLYTIGVAPLLIASIISVVVNIIPAFGSDGHIFVRACYLGIQQILPQ